MDSTTRKLLTPDQEASVQAFEDEHDQHHSYSAGSTGAACNGDQRPGFEDDAHPRIGYEYSAATGCLHRQWADRSTDTVQGAPVCTCECLRPATHLEPAEWQQDPDCPVHPMAAVDEPEQPIVHLRGQLERYETARSRLDPIDDKYRNARSGELLLAGQGLALAGQRVLDAVDSGSLLLPELARTEDLDEGPSDGCAQGTVDPWVDRIELLRIAAGRPNMGGAGIVPLAAQLEHFVLHGSDLGRPAPKSSAVEMLRLGLHDLDFEGDALRLATDLAEVLYTEHNVALTTTAPEATF